jgi:thioredoxin-related protein/YHS domain-containing protein
MFRKLAHTLSLCLTLIASVVLSAGAQADGVQWSTDIEGSLKHAAATGKPVLMEFTASWCAYCQRMEKTTFADPAVVARITENFVPVKVDADKHKDLVADLSIKGLPAILIVSSDLQIIERISGFQTPEALLGKLARVSGSVKPPISVPAAAPTTIVASPNQNSEKVQAQPGNRRELEFEPITNDEASGKPKPASIRAVSQPVTAELNSNRSSKSSARQTSAAAASESDQFLNAIAAEGSTRGTAAATETQPAFHGSCLVSAVEDREIVSGSPKFQTRYRGQVLYFRSPDHKQKFLAQPANYWPMLDGQCPITLLNDEQKVAGELQYAAVFRKRIWLFVSRETMLNFLEDPAEVVDEVAEQYPTP